MRPAIAPPTEGAAGPPGAIASRLFTRTVRLSALEPMVVAGKVVPDLFHRWVVCLAVYVETTVALPQLDHDSPAGRVRLICHS